MQNRRRTHKWHEFWQLVQSGGMCVYLLFLPLSDHFFNNSEPDLSRFEGRDSNILCYLHEVNSLRQSFSKSLRCELTSHMGHPVGQCPFVCLHCGKQEFLCQGAAEQDKPVAKDGDSTGWQQRSPTAPGLSRAGQWRQQPRLRSVLEIQMWTWGRDSSATAGSEGFSLGGAPACCARPSAASTAACFHPTSLGVPTRNPWIF